MTLPDREGLSRREYVKSLVAVGGAGALAACLGDGDGTDIPTGTDAIDELPAGQHEWNSFFEEDEHGNVRLPRHHVLAYLELDGEPTDSDRETVESALQTLERAYEWSNEGLVFTIGYSPSYFDRYDESLPETVDLPAPTSLTSLETLDEDDLDTYDALVHFASDEPVALLEAELAMFGESDQLSGSDAEPRDTNADTVNGIPVEDRLSDVFDLADRRTGFFGAGLPTENTGATGIPDDYPIPEEAPMFMGFRGRFKQSQPTEERVTIQDGPFAGGTTQHVSKIRQQLDQWWEQDSQAVRVAKMFSPTHEREDRVGEYGEKFTDSSEIEDVVEDTESDASSGMVGHAQKTARAREDGSPIIYRRDFDTTDDDIAGLHFVSLQREIEDFVTTRDAMTGADLPIGSILNNGILQYISVRRRGNFLLPPRAHRALPSPRPE